MRQKEDCGGYLCYGSWQTYRDRFAFSHVAPTGDATAAAYAVGLRKTPMLDAVGAIDDVVLYHPIWVLPEFEKGT